MTGHSRPILVPLDGSTNAEVALSIAVHVGRMLGAPLRVVHAVDHERAADAAAIDHARGTFRDYVDRLLHDRGVADMPHTTEVVHGSAAQTILDLAADARMVVIATHGRGGVKAAIIGSVADKVVRGAEVPVLAVPLGAVSAELRGNPIVVALDGSEVAEAGLAAARELAVTLQSSIVLVRAYTIPPPGVDFVAYPVDLSTILREGAEEYLKERAQPGEDTVCRLGTAVDVILETADKVDAGLVVMTSQGKGFAKRIALGSTTDRAIHRLKRPVLVVPADRRSSAE